MAKASTPVVEQLGTDVSGSASQTRMVPQGQAASAGTVEAAPAKVEGEPEDVDLGGDSGAFFPTLLWAGVLVLVGRSIFLVGQRWLRRPAYAMGGSVLVIVLYQFFGSLNRLLPAAL